MILNTVTITGADEAVNLVDLVKIEQEYPFVEFAYLMGAKTRPVYTEPLQPRYPNLGWIISALEMCKNKGAIHLCGAMLREFYLDKRFFEDRFPLEKIGRVQLNVGAKHDIPWSFLKEKTQQLGINFIIQTSRKRGDIISFPEFHYLLDDSGGRNIATRDTIPQFWSTPQSINLGFAGGFNLENVTERLNYISTNLSKWKESNNFYWIDIESGVRVDNQFNCELARQFLANCKPFVNYF